MSDVLNGGLIDPEIPGGRAGARLSLDAVAVALVAEVRDGVDVPLARRLPLQGASLEVGGASGVMLFVRHACAPGVTVYTEDAALVGQIGSAQPWGDQTGLFAELERARRGARLAIPAWIAAFALVGFLIFRSLDALVGLVPMSVDKQIGAFAEPQMLSQSGGPVMHDATVTKAVRDITKRLVKASAMPDLEVKVSVVDAPAVNAFALPGGYLVVYTGLLRDASGPEEVAGVLAHEIGHVTERHGLRRLGRSAGVVLLVDTILGDVAGMLGAAKEFFTLAAVNDYSREQEDAADAAGVRTMHAAGIDPAASRAFFERLAKEASALEDNAALAWISTHPSHSERVAAIDAQIKALGPTEVRPLDIDWVAVKKVLGDE